MSDAVKLLQVALASAAVEAGPLMPLAQECDGPPRFVGADGVATSGAFETAEGGHPTPRADEPPLRVMALHALLYCERLFYLEEVEELRVADGAVYAGRRLHDDVAPLDDESPEQRSVEVASEVWGLFGKVDAVRRRDGLWVAYEHKRGRCRRGDNGSPLPWPSDRIQVIAYAVLLEEEFGESVPEARIRYHADHGVQSLIGGHIPVPSPPSSGERVRA